MVLEELMGVLIVCGLPLGQMRPRWQLFLKHLKKKIMGCSESNGP